MRLSFVEPDNRDLRSVGVTPPLFENNSSVGTLQGPVCGFILQGRPKGSDDKVRRCPGSVTKLEDVGAAGGQSQGSGYERAQTQMCQVPKHPRDDRQFHVP